MDACQTVCRVLMVLLGLFSFSVIIFIFCDLGMDFMVCKLPFAIIGRFAIAFSTLYITSCCGLLPKPKIPMLSNWPAPWKLWEYYRSFCLCKQHQNISADDFSQLIERLPHFVTIPFARQRYRGERSLRIFHNFYESVGRPYAPAEDYFPPDAFVTESYSVLCPRDTRSAEKQEHLESFESMRRHRFSAVDFDQPSTSRSPSVRSAPPVPRHRSKRSIKMYGTLNQSTGSQYASAEDSCLPEASSKADNLSLSYQVHDQLDKIPRKTRSKRRYPKKVRFALPKIDEDRESGEGIEDNDVPPYKKVFPNIELKETQQRNPIPPGTEDSMDLQRTRLVDIGVKLEPRSILKQTGRDSPSRVLVEQNAEGDEGSLSAVPLPMAISSPEKPVHDAPGTLPEELMEISRMFALAKESKDEVPTDTNVPPCSSVYESGSSETDPDEVLSFDEDIANKMSP